MVVVGGGSVVVVGGGVVVVVGGEETMLMVRLEETLLIVWASKSYRVPLRPIVAELPAAPTALKEIVATFPPLLPLPPAQFIDAEPDVELAAVANAPAEMPVNWIAPGLLLDTLNAKPQIKVGLEETLTEMLPPAPG